MKTRILTALAGIPLVLLLLFASGGRWWAAGVAVVMAMALYEYTVSLRKHGVWVHWIAVGVYAAALWLSVAPVTVPPGVEQAARWLLRWEPERGYVGPAMALAALLAGDLVWNRRAPLRNVGATLLGAGYIGALFPFLVLLRGSLWHGGSVALGGWRVEAGAWMVLCVLLTIWAGDSAAYFVGRAFGRHPCAPAISPNKTWEGVLGGLAASTVAGPLALLPLGAGAVAGALFGLCVGAAGQVGDLVESAMKREAGVKDFGALLPGHGGILDRFDSLLFAAPMAYLLLRWLIPGR